MCQDTNVASLPGARSTFAVSGTQRCRKNQLTPPLCVDSTDMRLQASPLIDQLLVLRDESIYEGLDLLSNAVSPSVRPFLQRKCARASDVASRLRLEDRRCRSNWLCVSYKAFIIAQCGIV